MTVRLTLSRDSKWVYLVDIDDTRRIVSTHRSKRAAVRAYAARLHRCPDGYEGPCWGPTEEDIEMAKRALGLAR